MRYLQRGLSDLLNLFIHDPDDPEHLWPWWELGLYGGIVGACLVALSPVG